MNQTMLPSSSASGDVVGVYDGFTQVFRDARPMKVSVRKEARLMDHPLDNSCTTTDHMVILPAEVVLSMTLTPDSCPETHREISDYFMQGKILTVRTKVATYPNMLIQSLPHEETPALFDTVTMTLKLREVTFAQPEFSTAFNPKKPSQARAVEIGEVQPVKMPKDWFPKNIKW